MSCMGPPALLGHNYPGPKSSGLVEKLTGLLTIFPFTSPILRPEAMKNAALADVKKHLDLLTGSRDALEVTWGIGA